MLRHARNAALVRMAFGISFVLSVTPVFAYNPNTHLAVNENGSAPLPGASSPASPVDGSPAKETKPSISVSNPSPKQGETVKVILSGLDHESSDPAFVSFEGNKIKLFKETAEGKWSCLLGIPVTIDPGVHKIAFGDTTTKALKVVDAKYPTRRLRLPKTKNNFKASPGEKETIKKAKLALSDEKRWSGKFEKPVKKARISSVFGIRRIVNGKLLKDYFHSGTDFAAPRGTPIYAPADGKVIVAKTGWKLHGNTICLDHGRGVVSIYIHMNSLKVKEGDMVKAGQHIGAVGSTGRASGPHLHFGVYVNNEATDPMNWFSKVY